MTHNNMRTMGAMRADKRRAKSRETLEVFFRWRYFHFQRIASELESLAYRWLYPRRWAVLGAHGPPASDPSMRAALAWFAG